MVMGLMKVSRKGMVLAGGPVAREAPEMWVVAREAPEMGGVARKAPEMEVVL